MAYRNGTYVAFDGGGTSDPTVGDMKYYAMLQAWNKDKKHDFHFNDSHKKTYSVRDSSQMEATLKPRLLERMKNSKNMLLILSENTNWDRGLLNYEIEMAVDRYKIPIIAAYPGKTNIIYQEGIWYKLYYKQEFYPFPVLSGRTIDISSRWPQALRSRIINGTARCIHIPFKMEPIVNALEQFTCFTNKLSSSRNTYDQKTYQKWGMIEFLE
ncbi:MAG: hypothetical protein Q4D38_01595 [Planctomycetia bacterium]|nr:hypothetical protein [Planctomycetia bacterium]